MKQYRKTYSGWDDDYMGMCKELLESKKKASTKKVPEQTVVGRTVPGDDLDEVSETEV